MARWRLWGCSLGLTLAGAWAMGCGSEDPGPGGGSGGSGGNAGQAGDAGTDAPSDVGADGNSDAAPDAGQAPTFVLPEPALTAARLGVLVNEDDPQSVALADYYVAARGIPAANVVKLSFPTNTVMTEANFDVAKAKVDSALGGDIQALAITWTRPYRVACMSVTSAFALGFDDKYCNTTGGACGPTAAVPTFDSDTAAPFDDFQIRPTMMLVGADLDFAKALVDRGVAADDTFPTGNGFMVRTTDTARSVRWPSFVSLLTEWPDSSTLDFSYVDNADGSGSNVIEDEENILFYFTGLATVPQIASNTYRPGAIADHLTSFGGQVPTAGQMSVAKWIEAGVTGSFGTVVEPCNYLVKFPDPRVVVRRYYRGESLVEAYWKSVAAPGEGLFVGEPLARPFGTEEITYANGALSIRTTHLDPKKSYAIEGADQAAGPFAPVQTGITIANHQRITLTVDPADLAFYRIVEE